MLPRCSDRTDAAGETESWQPLFSRQSRPRKDFYVRPRFFKLIPNMGRHCYRDMRPASPPPTPEPKSFGTTMAATISMAPWRLSDASLPICRASFQAWTPESKLKRNPGRNAALTEISPPRAEWLVAHINLRE